MEKLLDFLHSREKILENNKINSKFDKFEKNSPRNDNSSKHHSGNNHVNRTAFSYATHTKIFCHVCKNPHYTQAYEKLKNANLKERLEIIKNLKLCLNCLRTNHTFENCNASMCKVCNQKHHALLHEKKNNQSSGSVNFSSLQNTDSSSVLLSTVVLHVLDHKGNPHTCRALLDNRSQVNFLIEKLTNKLGLKQLTTNVALGGVNSMNSSVNKITKTIIQSQLNNFSANLSFLITPEINNYTPCEQINKTLLKIPLNIRLADHDFNVPGEIDMLTGAEIFFKLLCVGQLSVANDNVTLQKTHLG